MISIYYMANCNFAYITGLMGYLGRSRDAMAALLTQPKGIYAKPTDPPVYREPTGGFLLFAQDSDYKTADRPYCPQFEALIHDEGLGSVCQHDAPNPAHDNRIGSLYVWAVNHAALRRWWHKNVLTPWQDEQRTKK